MSKKSDPMWIRQLRALARKNRWEGCDIWEDAIRVARRYKGWRDAWGKCKAGSAMITLLEGLRLTDINRPQTPAGKRFEVAYTAYYEKNGEPFGGKLANLIRKYWPKPPKLPALKGGK